MPRCAPGGLPEDLVERYFDGTLTLWIAAPDEVSVGETLFFGVGGDYRGSMWTSNRKLAVFFLTEEMTISGPPPEPEQSQFVGVPIQGQALGTAQMQPYGSEVDRSVPANGGPMVRMPVSDDTELSSLELRVMGTIFFIDYTTVSQWSPPELDAAIWSKRVDLRKTVRIEN